MSGQDNDHVFGPYEPIRKAADWYFVSGQVGVEPVSKRASEMVTMQTEQALRNMASVLEGAGLEMRNVVKTTVYLTDMSDFEAMNNVYVQHFEAPRPARAAVAVKELPRVGGDVDLRVEIEAIAMIGGK